MAESQQIDDFIVINDGAVVTIIDVVNAGIVKIPRDLLSSIIEKLSEL